MKRITLITILTLIQATGCLAQIDPNIPVTGRIVQKINAPGRATDRIDPHKWGGYVIEEAQE